MFESDTRGQANIFSMNLDGTNWKQLTDFGADSPKLSPDGTRIAFTSEVNGNFDIYSMNTEGGELVQLTNSPGNDFDPDWSPDGSQIAFISRRDDGGVTNLYVMNADGSEQRALSDTPNLGERSPAWSPDADKIIFTQTIDGNGDGRLTGVWVDVKYLCVLYLSTTQVDCITAPSEGEHTDKAVWHPNSYTILYGSVKPGEYWKIWQMNIDGTEARPLITSANSDVPQAYSSDGSKILFRSWRHGHWEIFVANSDGSNHILLTDNQDNNSGAHWVE